jgi:hypothetical protein
MALRIRNRLPALSLAAMALLASSACCTSTESGACGVTPALETLFGNQDEDLSNQGAGSGGTGGGGGEGEGPTSPE